MNLDITMTFQKTKIADEIELHRPCFQPCKSDHLGEVAPAIGPVKSENRRAVPCSGREALTLIGSKLVERYGSNAFSLDHYFGGSLKLSVGPALLRRGASSLIVAETAEA